MIGPWLVLVDAELLRLDVEPVALSVHRRGLPGGRLAPHVDVYVDSLDTATMLLDEYGLRLLRGTQRTLVAEGVLRTAAVDVGVTVFAEVDEPARVVDEQPAGAS